MNHISASGSLGLSTTKEDKFDTLRRWLSRIAKMDCLGFRDTACNAQGDPRRFTD